VGVTIPTVGDFFKLSQDAVKICVTKGGLDRHAATLWR